MAPPFRAEQIGSLLRPAPLIAARSAAMSDAAGTHIQTLPLEVQRLTDEAIAYAVRKQDELSIRPFTSGEYERHIFYSGMFEKLGGFEVIEEIPIVEGFRTKLPSVAVLQSKGVKTRPGIIATGKISHVKDVYMSEWEGLKKLLPESKWHECKLTIPSITWQHLQ
jgi:methionine synthase II (cobalamin-independent)